MVPYMFLIGHFPRRYLEHTIVFSASNCSYYAPESIFLKFYTYLDIVPVDIYIIWKTNVIDHIFRNKFYWNSHISKYFQRILMRAYAFNLWLVLVPWANVNIYSTSHRTTLRATKKNVIWTSPRNIRNIFGVRWLVCMAK